jgi:hypothetical protein
MMIDPEGSMESTSHNGNVFNTPSDDPWYTNSGENTPRNSESKGYTANYNMYNNNELNNTVLFSNDEDYENEPPLMEELGVRFDHIWSKTQAVLYPTQVLKFCLNLL